MIKCNKNLLVIDFLNNIYPSKDEVNVIVCDGFDCIETPNGTRVFGVFIPDQLKIYIAEDIPEKEYTVQHTIAHEYRHYIQYKNGKRFDEQDANDFADGVMHRLQQLKEGKS